MASQFWEKQVLWFIIRSRKKNQIFNKSALCGQNWPSSVHLESSQHKSSKSKHFFNTDSLSVYNTCLHAKAKHSCNNLALVNLLHSLHHYALKSKVRSRQTGLGTGSWLCENAYSNTDIWGILSQGLTVPKCRFMQGFLFFSSWKFENWMMKEIEKLDGDTYQDVVIVFISAIWQPELQEIWNDSSL